MTTAFSAITAAFVATLSAVPAVSDNIFRQRERPFTSGMNDGVNVQFDGSVPSEGEITGAPVDWRSRITVECYARSSSTSGDLAVDPLLQKVYARIAADSTLGGLVDRVSAPLVETECDALGQKTGVIKLTYMVEHRTSELTVE